jgi:DNA replication protein DnaC
VPANRSRKRSAVQPGTERPAARAAAPGQDALRERLRGHLLQLGLKDLDQRLDAHLDAAVKQRPSYLTLFARVLGETAAHQRERRIERRIAASGLKVRKTLAAFDWDFQPKLDRALVEDLATLRFVERGEDVLFTGKSGTGKSHVLQSFVLKACEQDLSVRYARCSDLLDDLHAGLADGTYEQRLKRWCRPALLVIDDLGLGQVKKRDDEPTAAHTLFNLLDRRHARVSTAVTSNIKLSAWGKYLGDATLAAALLDRLVMNATRIDIDGPSYRQHVARTRSEAAGKSD